MCGVIIHQHDRGSRFLLTEAARLLRKLLDRRLQHWASRAQWSVLAILANRDGMSQSQLADVLEIEKTTAGRLIDHLETNGWVERRPIPGDRRLWAVYLSVRSPALIAQVKGIVHKVRIEMLDGLSAQQAQEFVQALQSVKASLARASQAAADASAASAASIRRSISPASAR